MHDYDQLICYGIRNINFTTQYAHQNTVFLITFISNKKYRLKIHLESRYSKVQAGQIHSPGISVSRLVAIGMQFKCWTWGQKKHFKSSSSFSTVLSPHAEQHSFHRHPGLEDHGVIDRAGALQPLTNSFNSRGSSCSSSPSGYCTVYQPDAWSLPVTVPIKLPYPGKYLVNFVPSSKSGTVGSFGSTCADVGAGTL